MRPFPAFPRACRLAGGALLLCTGLALLFSTLHGRPAKRESITADALAQNGLTTILGDLTQEIVAGSNATTLGSTTIYLPKAPATAVPAQVGSTGTGGLENLLKRSAFGLPIYPTANHDGSAPNRAASVSTAASSSNGLAILPTRWNRPLLLSKANATSSVDLSPVSTGADAFVPPDWVLVARDGSNPTQWNPDLRTSDNGPTSVVGRYAYTIYNEGGLLDMTVAGYPTGTTNQTTSYKRSLGAADLTQVGLSRAQIDAIISYRAAHPFLGRQDLLNYFTGTLATNDSGRAGLQGVLRYLGTFTRGLSQPSYAPVSRVSSATNPNPRPMILASTAGGNNVGDAYPAAVDQDALSPNFLTVRAQTDFFRNDGTMAVIGEPLVKRRFALQRLAWLTYKGPSANRAGVAAGNPTDADTAALVANGVPVSVLQQGTASSIQRYFGLIWDGTRWMYNAHNRPSNGSVGDANSGAIHQLVEVATLKTREPDFFELLKASVDPGALAKTSTNGPLADPDGPLGVLNFQYSRDINLDASIMQMGANIIDQFDTDGYPTRIVFDDGSGKPAREFRGVENLPYIYRIHPGVLKAREANPTSVGVNTSTAVLHSDSSGIPKPDSLIDTGVGLLMAVPDLWNPHDQNSTLGNPRPGGNAASFRVIANSTTPDHIGAGLSNTLTVGGFVIAQNAGNYKGNSYDSPGNVSGGPVAPTSVTPNAPYFSRDGTATNLMTGGNYGYTNPQVIDLTTSSALAFSVPDAAIFREPTMLATPNVAGSGLSMLITNPDITGLRDSNTLPVYTNSGGYSGLRSVNINPFSTPGGVASSTSPPLYTGIFLGAYPLRWVGTRYANSSQNTTGWVYTDSLTGVSGTPVNGITYSLQCQDESGNWVTYDEKYVNTSLLWLNSLGALIQPGVLDYSFIDPRTGRFGSPTETNIADTAHYRAPAVSANWLDAANRVSITERPDYHGGFGTNFRGNYSSSLDWSTYTALGWHYKNVGIGTAVNAVFFEGGLFSQNNPYWASDGIRYNGGTGPGAQDPTFYSDTDGVVRRAMGGHIPLGSTSNLGQPLATASVISNGRATPTALSASRPKMLNRPFRSVAELGYVFSGNPWKNLDLSAPESGYSGVLDVFCVSDSADPAVLVAGRLNLNTRQPLVLQAVLSGAYTSESNGLANSAITVTEASDIANRIITRTSRQPAAGPNTSNGPQPLVNLSDLVGHWNSRQAIGSDPANPLPGYVPALDARHNIDGRYSYDGFSWDIDSLAITNTLRTTPIAAVRESVARTLANVGDTRVWNLLIDLVAQTGEYSANATNLGQFTVAGTQRYWLHVAIDRFTGQVLEQSLETIPEVIPSDVTLSNLTLPENQQAGTAVGTLGAVDANPAATFRYALVGGTGGDDNASFAISGGTLQTAAPLRYLDKSSYRVRVQVIDQDGVSLEKTFTIAVLPGAYTQWKVANFQSDANNPTIAGDLADPDGDGMANLVEYALGKSPTTADASGITVQRVGNSLRLDYTRSSTATDATTQVYWNTDLTNPNGWRSDGVTATMLSDDGTQQHWQADLPLGSNPNAFLRLQVTSP